MPIIPVNPITPSPSTGWGTVSGIVPASGLETTLSGPWMIEEQELTIQYIRVPSYGNATVSHSLSGPTRTIAVLNTAINHVVTARYSVRKSYEVFSTSAWTQPQTFQYNTLSGDPYGNTYGDVGISAIGPMGTINTKHKWYYRREWDSAIDSEASQSMFGTQHYYGNPDLSGTPWFEPFKDGTAFFGEFERNTPRPSQADTFLSDYDYALGGGNAYWLGGAYYTTQEDPLQIQMYITQAGDDVMNIKYYGIGNDLTTGSSGYPAYTQGCSGYRTSRHSF